MKKGKNFRTILTTVDNIDLAKKIALKLVDDEIAACVNIIPNILSIYKWENRTNEDNELMLFIKTKKNNLKKVEETILSLHTYSTPEIISFKINKGNKVYLDWLSDSLKNINNLHI